MSIHINNKTIYIENETYTILELYDFINEYNQNINDQVMEISMVRLRNTYELSDPIVLRNSGTLDISNTLVYYNATKLTINSTGALVCSNGEIDAPNLELLNAFGSDSNDINDSGSLFINDSKINIPCFWTFYNTNNTIEILNSEIRGHGRLSGHSVNFRNNKLLMTNGLYGGFSYVNTDGSIKDNVILEITPHELDANFINPITNDHSIKSGIYYDPEEAGDLTHVGGEINDYDHVAYIKSGLNVRTLKILDTKLKNGYNIYREDDKVDFYHNFTFAPMIKNENNEYVEGAEVICEDVTGKEVFRDTTNMLGMVTGELNHFYSSGDGQFNEIKNPHTITIKKDTSKIELIINVTDSLRGNVFYLPSNCSDSSTTGSIDYDRIQDMINANSQATCECVSNKMDVVDNNIRHIMSGMGAELDMVKEITEGSNGVVIHT